MTANELHNYLAAYDADDQDRTPSDFTVLALRTAALGRVVAENERLRDRLEGVEALHHRRPWSPLDSVTFGQTEFPDQCNHCRTSWPCRTRAALEEGR